MQGFGGGFRRFTGSGTSVAVSGLTVPWIIRSATVADVYLLVTQSVRHALNPVV